MKRFLLAATFLYVPVANAEALVCSTSKQLAVNADGSPDSYLVNGQGLSPTCSGVFAIVNGVPHTQKNDLPHWQTLCASYWAKATATGNYSNVKIVGFEKDHGGSPIIQGPDDPLPGTAYVSTTALTIPDTPPAVQRHYVNSREVPYVDMSKNYALSHGLRLGDVVAVYRPKTDRIAYAVYGDCCSLGEGSIRLHQDLGSNPIHVAADGTKRASSGIKDRIVFIPLTGAHTHPTSDSAKWRKEILDVGTTSLNKIGGVAAVKNCAVHQQ